MSNVIRCVDHRFVFKNSGIACLALIFNLSYLTSTIPHPKKQCETVQVIWLFIYRFFSDNWYEHMAEWLRLVGYGLETLVRFPHGADSFCRAAAILRGTEPVSALTPWHARFLYCCTLYNFFLSWISSVAISRSQGFNSWIWTSDFHSFGALGWKPGARTLQHVRAWHMSVIIAIVEPRS